MNVFSNRQRTWTVIGALVGIVVILVGVLFLVNRDQAQPPGATPTVSSTQPTTPVSPTVPETTPPGTTAPGSTAPGSTAQTPSSTAQTMTVRVYFNDDVDDPTHVVALDRTVPSSPQVATAALRELLAGPTAAERNAGYYSWFSSATADMLISVRVTNGVGYVNFRDFSGIIPNASTSSGSAALMAQLDSTLKQFPTVRSTVYAFNGDVQAFYFWLQLTPPASRG